MTDAERPYHLIHSNVDGAGEIPGDYTTLDEARDYAILHQMVSDAGGNDWGYRYNVFGYGRRLYRTQQGERLPVERIIEMAEKAEDGPYRVAQSIVRNSSNVTGPIPNVAEAIRFAIKFQGDTDYAPLNAALGLHYYVHGKTRTWYATLKGEKPGEPVKAPGAPPAPGGAIQPELFSGVPSTTSGPVRKSLRRIR